ncbi:MAG: hypothetical protein HWD58_18950 [Bacteroidota bacterium]|nr:MAG: hypothetical protein HWD58_18950 [Bacteroidota bacterium]
MLRMNICGKIATFAKPQTVGHNVRTTIALRFGGDFYLKSAGKRMTNRQFFISFTAPKLVTEDLSPVLI